MPKGAKSRKLQSGELDYNLIKEEYRIQNNQNATLARDYEEEVVEIPDDSRDVVEYLIEQPTNEASNNVDSDDPDDVEYVGYFYCTPCKKNFPHHRALMEHRRQHLEGKPLTCTICNQKFNNTKALCLHIISHDSKQSCECRVCGKKFLDNHTLTCHLIEGDPIIGKEYLASGATNQLRKCDQCSRFLIDDWHFNRHIQKNHTCNGGPFTAGPSRPTRIISRKRKQTHSIEEELVECSVCNRYFSNRQQLAHHINLSHLG